MLDVIEDEGLLANAATVGDALRAGLAAIDDPRHRRCPRRRPLRRRRGGAVTRKPRHPTAQEARRLVNALRERRVLISVCGHDGNVLKIRPPLVFSMADVDWFCSAFTEALAA